MNDSRDLKNNINTTLGDSQKVSGKVKQNLFLSNEQVIEYSQTEDTPKIPYLPNDF